MIELETTFIKRLRLVAESGKFKQKSGRFVLRFSADLKGAMGLVWLFGVDWYRKHAK